MYERLLVPVDGSEFSEKSVTQSVALARQLGARIVGFVAEPTMTLPNMAVNPSAYARESDAHDARTDEHAKAVLAKFEAAARTAEVAFHGVYSRASNVEQAIAQAASENECDMIVMATHGRGALGELVFGSHTKGVIARTRIPVLVLH